VGIEPTQFFTVGLRPTQLIKISRQQAHFAILLQPGENTVKNLGTTQA
jgi:hypothetical protein